MSSKKPAAAKAVPEPVPGPVRDHFVPGVAGPMTAEESAAWWVANPPPEPDEPAVTEAPETPGPPDVAEE